MVAGRALLCLLVEEEATSNGGPRPTGLFPRSTLLNHIVNIIGNWKRVSRSYVLTMIAERREYCPFHAGGD